MRDLAGAEGAGVAAGPHGLGASPPRDQSAKESTLFSLGEALDREMSYPVSVFMSKDARNSRACFKTLLGP